MSNTIADDNAELKDGEALIRLARELPLEEDVRDLAETMSNVRTLPDRFNNEFLDAGWVYVGRFCGFQSAETAITMKLGGASQHDIDTFLADNLLNIDPIYYQSLRLLGGGIAEPKSPIRVEVTERAFAAFRSEDYLIAVPLFLMLIDSFSISETSKSVFSSISETDSRYESTNSIAGHPTALRQLITVLTRGSQKYSEEKIETPYRNQILHGLRLNYANKTAATKAVCLLAALLEWRADTLPESREGTSKKERNLRFLDNALKFIDLSTPEAAISSLQEALDRNHPHHAVACIGYTAGLTDLQRKICEWREILQECKPKIQRLSEWQIFGKHAKCKGRVTLEFESKEPVVAKDVTLYAEYGDGTLDIEDRSIWRIDVSILGNIRRLIGTKAGTAT